MLVLPVFGNGIEAFLDGNGKADAVYLQAVLASVAVEEFNTQICGECTEFRRN